MEIGADQIKELRKKTNASISDIKRALEEGRGDMARALVIIEHKFGSTAVEKAGRETGAGIVDFYIHSNGRIGVLIELLCETDFVARSPIFKELAHNLAMHAAAMKPLYISLEDIPQDLWTVEKSKFTEEARALEKSSHTIEEVVDGKLRSHFAPVSFMLQPFIKNPDKTVREIINEAVGKFGENIKIGKFSRFEI